MRGSGSDHVFVDHFRYALGDTKTSLAESEQAGRLRSSATDLAAAGFAWHHVCRPATTAYDLAVSAVRKLPDDVVADGFDAIVYATCLPLNGNTGDEAAWRSTRDVSHLMDFPGSRLQVDFSFDRAVVVGLNQQGCTTMLGALRVARALLLTEPDWQKILCVTADRFPDTAIYEQAYNVISDGAAACVVSRQPGGLRLIAAHQITNGGLHAATDDERVGTYFSSITTLVKQLLDRVGLTAADIGWVVPQNTHRSAWQIMSRLLGIDMERVWQPTLSDIGHAISADNVINVAELIRSGQLRAGQYVLLLMAGHGLNWQAVLLQATEA